MKQGTRLPKLNENQTRYREMLKGARAGTVQLNGDIQAYYNACEHLLRRTSLGTAMCVVCESIRGHWYCPDSPDHICHYEINENGKIDLLLSMKPNEINPPKDYDDGMQGDCVYCYQPKERK